MKHLSDYAIKRLADRAERIERERETRKDRLKAILWAVGDGIAWVVIVIAITTATMLDSESFVPGIVLGVSVFYLAIYGAVRGVLG